MQFGVLAGYPMVGVKATLLDGRDAALTHFVVPGR